MIVLVVLFAIFVLSNTQTGTVDWIVAEARAPLIVLLLVSFVVGVIVGWFVTWRARH